MTANYDLAVCKNNDIIINEREVVGICNEGKMLGVLYQAGFNVSTSVTCSIVKNYNQLLIYKKALVIDKPIIDQLRKKMRQLKMSGTAQIEIEQVACFTTKTDTKSVVFITLKMYHYSWNDLL